MRFVDTIRPGNHGFKWTPPQQLHFTLKFLGVVTPADKAALTVKLREVAAQTAGFGLSLGAPGFFPHVKNPRILWLGLAHGEAAICSLAAAVETACLEKGFSGADKPFRPHITIARASPDGSAPIVLPVDTGFKKIMTVDCFSLIESKLTPEGPLYRTVAEFPLKKP